MLWTAETVDLNGPDRRRAGRFVPSGRTSSFTVPVPRTSTSGRTEQVTFQHSVCKSHSVCKYSVPGPPPTEAGQLGYSFNGAKAAKSASSELFGRRFIMRHAHRFDLTFNTIV